MCLFAKNSRIHTTHCIASKQFKQFHSDLLIYILYLDRSEPDLRVLKLKALIKRFLFSLFFYTVHFSDEDKPRGSACRLGAQLRLIF